MDSRFRGKDKRLAERTGFEPAVACATTVFKTVTFNHSVTSPDWKRRNRQG